MKPKISTRIVCYVAMLIALAVVLERLASLINLPTIRISFAFIPMMCCGMLFGPVWGALAFGIADLLGWPVMGLAPIPLILVSRIVQGFIYGILLYREDAKFAPHAIAAALAVELVCSAGLTTLGLSHFFGSPYIPLLVSRLPQLAVMFVLQLALFPILVRLRTVLRKTGVVLS